MKPEELSPETKLEAWGPGPWVDEPDRLEWRYNGIPCLIVRNPSLGHWCGYAAVPPGHPWHGLAHDDGGPASAHGGITYAGACSGHVCHVPVPGEPDDVWWLGFDCGHAGDFIPSCGQISLSTLSRGAYRDVLYVRAQCEELAKQVIAAAP